MHHVCRFIGQLPVLREGLSYSRFFFLILTVFYSHKFGFVLVHTASGAMHCSDWSLYSTPGHLGFQSQTGNPAVDPKMFLHLRSLLVPSEKEEDGSTQLGH